MKLSYSNLSRHLQASLEPVYLLSGDQELLRELAAKRLERAVVGDSPSSFNLERFDGEVAEADAIVMTANMFPLLGGRRFLFVRRATRLVEGEEVLTRYLDSPSPATVLVLDLEKKPDGRRKSWKELEKKAAVVVCDAPKGVELEEWVSEEARLRGLRLEREDVRYLVEELGSNLRRILNEVEKLSLYAGGEQLEVEAITEVLGRGRAQSIFQFIDALTAGDARAALRQLGRLLEEGEAPLRILALLDRLVGQLRIAREAQSEGGRGPGLASVLGVPPSAARRLSERARRLDEAWLRKAVSAVAQTDRTLKSSGLPQRVVLESLVISLARGTRGRRAQALTDASRRASRDL